MLRNKKLRIFEIDTLIAKIYWPLIFKSFEQNYRLSVEVRQIKIINKTTPLLHLYHITTLWIM